MKNRPDFQRLLRDIELGKTKPQLATSQTVSGAKLPILCDCLNILNGIMSPLLVCSNNINTQNSTPKIIIQVLAIIAEFERDILNERIQSNPMELAKDGRQLGDLLI